MAARSFGRSIAASLLVGAGLVLSACSTQEVLDLSPAAVQPLSDRYALHVTDYESGRVLASQDAAEIRHPASLTKMMTLYMLFDALEGGRIRPDSEIPFSAYAAGRPPSKLGVKAGDTITVDMAVRALAVKSANDVASAVAEFMSGSEEAFAIDMTRKARSLGMNRTFFVNASGLPDDRQISTAADMDRLGTALIRDHPRYYPFFNLRQYEFRGQTIRGHNRLLEEPGVDGIKTGYIRASGFNIVTSVRKGGRRYVIK